MKKIVLDKSIPVPEESVYDIDVNDTKFIAMYHRGHFGLLCGCGRKVDGIATFVYSMPCLDAKLHDYPWDTGYEISIVELLAKFLREGAVIMQFDTFLDTIEWMQDIVLENSSDTQ